MIEKAEEIFSSFMSSLWLDLTDPSLKNTPKRVARMFVNEICSWLYQEPPEITTFPNSWDDAYDWMVLVKDIEVKSLCEHHFQPFVWKAYIAYIPADRVVWLSKFSRIVKYWSKRPQVQERLTMQIYNHLKEVLWTDDIAIVISSEHFCMKLRWVEEPCSSTTTSKIWWRFFTDAKVREEFYHLISK